MSENGWHRVDPVDVPEEGRVGSLVVDGRPVALTRCGGQLGARLFATQGPVLLHVEQDAALL